MLCSLTQTHTAPRLVNSCYVHVHKYTHTEAHTHTHTHTFILPGFTTKNFPALGTCTYTCGLWSTHILCTHMYILCSVPQCICTCIQPLWSDMPLGEFVGVWGELTNPAAPLPIPKVGRPGLLLCPVHIYMFFAVHMWCIGSGFRSSLPQWPCNLASVLCKIFSCCCVHQWNIFNVHGVKCC